MARLLPLLVIVAAATAVPGSCPAGVNTACAGDGSQTCCPIFMSQSGWGCCNLPGASCCPQSATTQGCCPAGTSCVLTGPYAATCVPSAGGGANLSATQVCTPGARLPPSATQPSVIMIGDSVSEGYQPVVTANLSKVAFIQHSPWSTGGGADDVNNGLNCEEAFLRTAMYAPAKWDLITFNFGLHDLGGTDGYESALVNFTRRLTATGAKLAFVSTTPFMPDHYHGNTIVEQLNAIAQRVVAAAGVPYLDLYHHVTAYCGANYTACDICDDESSLWPAGPAGAHCGYHYTAAGYSYLSEFLSAALVGLLAQ